MFNYSTYFIIFFIITQTVLHYICTSSAAVVIADCTTAYGILANYQTGFGYKLTNGRYSIPGMHNHTI